MTQQTNLTVLFHGERHILSAAPDRSLLDTLQELEQLSLAAVCGGAGVCGKCKVQVLDGRLDPSPSDLAYFTPEELEAGYRLACAAYPAEPLTIQLLALSDGNIAMAPLLRTGGCPAQTLRVETRPLERSAHSVASQLAPDEISLTPTLLADCSHLADGETEEAQAASYLGQTVYIGATVPTLYAVGVDIGTTTITYALLSLHTGQVLAHLSETNRQRQYGADVVTRIMKASGGGLAALRKIVRRQVSGGIARLLADHGISADQVVKTAVAGNTTMLHLFLGLRCDLLGKYPYTPVTLEFLRFPYSDLLEGPLPRCTIDILPGLSAYVGADVTAGILMTGLHKAKALTLLVDIGTNGEMVLAGDGRMVCTSTSAGPSFEGANIRWGTSSVPGAICGVDPGEDRFHIRTIEDHPPVGICGSGVIDAAHACLRQGLLDATGRFAPTVDKRGVFLATTQEGEEIRFTQKDVRQLQLSKSAIRTGIDQLLAHCGRRCRDIETLYISGGFGCKINPQSGVGIGLIPADLEDRIVPVGNSALGGVIHYLLGAGGPRELHDIIDSCREFSLPGERTFQQIFIDNLSLKKY